MTVRYDSGLGILVQDNTPDPALQPGIPTFTAQLSQDLEINSCIMIVENLAYSVNATYSNPIVSKPLPSVEGVTLKSGIRGEFVEIAKIHGQQYTTTYSLGPNGQYVYVGFNGRLTSVKPLKSTGANYEIVVGRYINEFQFIFDPQIAIDLNAVTPSTPGGTPEVTQVICGEPIAQGTCIKIAADSKAYIVRSSDVNIPIIHAIALESGGIDSLIKIEDANGTFVEILTGLAPETICFLGKNGKPTNTIPTKESGDNYSVYVGQVLNVSNLFKFSPAYPIKLI